MTTGVLAPPTALEDPPMPPARRPVPLGLAEIAGLLGVDQATPTRWKYLRHRTKFPLPDGHISRSVPFWWDSTIEAWARATNRWPGDEVAQARAEAIAAREAAASEAEERRADADRTRERITALQRELEAAEAAAAAAEQRAAAPLA